MTRYKIRRHFQINFLETNVGILIHKLVSKGLIDNKLMMVATFMEIFMSIAIQLIWPTHLVFLKIR